jgi:hypothetical protein
LTLIAPIRPFQLCADGGYQLRLGVLGVPLIMVPDRCATSEECKTGIPVVLTVKVAQDSRMCNLWNYT